MKQEITSETVAQNTLRNQVGVLQAAGEPTTSSPEFQQALSTYLQLADSRDRLETQVLDNLDQARQILEQERQLLAGLQPDLKKMEEAWKTELLQRPPSRLSLKEQLVYSYGRPGRLARSGLAVAGRPGEPRERCGPFSWATWPAWWV